MKAPIKVENHTPEAFAAYFDLKAMIEEFEAGKIDGPALWTGTKAFLRECAIDLGEEE